MDESLPIFLDLETLPTSRQDVRARFEADVAPPANYKKAEAIEKWWAEEGDAAKSEAVARTALNGTFGELLCIGWAVGNGPVSVEVRTGSERELLETWAESLRAAAEAARPSDGGWWDRRAVWIGHNIEDFDLRFLWQRTRINGVRLPFVLPLDRYAKAPRRYDTMKEWGGWNGRVKQRDLEMAFGLERSDPLDLGGADVWTAYKEGRVADVVQHCTEDVRNLREIYRRMTA